MDHSGQHVAQVGNGRIAVPDSLRQRPQASLPSDRGQGSLFRLVWQVKIFKPLGCLRGENGRPERVGQLALGFYALENSLFAFPELPQILHARLDLPDDFFVEPARSLFAVTRDEGNGVALIEEHNDALHLKFADLQVLGNPREV